MLWKQNLYESRAYLFANAIAHSVVHRRCAKRELTLAASPILSTAAFLSDDNFLFKIKVLTRCFAVCAQCSPQKLCRKGKPVSSAVQVVHHHTAEAGKTRRKPDRIAVAYYLCKERKVFQINGLASQKAACSQSYPQKM